MSKRVLRGSDVYINWNVDIYRTDGTRVELSGISLGVQLIVREKVIDITRETHGLTITGNMITFSFLGRLQTYPGTYILKLYDKNSTSITYYTCSAFIVVDEPADDVESGSIIVDLESAILLSRVIEARGEKGEKGDPGVIGSILTIGENGNWFIDGIDTGISAYGSPGAYKSIVFTRRKTESPWKYGRPEGGSFDHPIPDNMEVMGESDIVWSDGIPDGTEMIWASMAIFTPGATQSPIWSIPQEMMDTSDYDVEFALKQGDEDTQPPAPSVEDNEDGNRHNANPRSNQIWYDPTKDDERLNGDWSHMFWRAERRLANGKWGNWVITRVKGEKGETGDKGNKSAEPRLYKRSAKTPLQPIHDDSWPSGTAIVYTFSDGKMVSDAADKKIPAGWSMLGDVPDGSDPLWVIGATAVAEYNDPDVKIFKNSWSAPTEYGSGDGLSCATLELYKRSEEKPLGIRWDTFYNFEEDTLSYTDPSSQIVYTLEPNVQEPDVTIDGWRRYIPPVGDASNHLWTTRAPAVAHGGGIDEIEEQEWSPPARVGGEPGKNGQRSTVVQVYRRCPLGTVLTAADKPSAPSGSVTYSFEENRLLVDSIDGNWYATVPDDKDEGLVVWVSMATASCDAKYMETEILNNQWSGPVEWGTDKINNFPLALYQRSATKPAPPNTMLYYRFSNSAVYVGSIDGPAYGANNSASFAGGWSRVEPSGSTQCWITRATAVSYEDYDDIDTGEWSDPSKHVKDGGIGPTSVQVKLYKNSETKPARPKNDSNWPSGTYIRYNLSNDTMTVRGGGLSAFPVAGWTTEDQVSRNQGDKIWATTAIATGQEDSYDDISKADWSDPVPAGILGKDGINCATLTLYQSSADTPVGISSRLRYDFENDVLIVLDSGGNPTSTTLTSKTGAVNGWRRYVPTRQPGDPVIEIWQTTASALSEPGYYFDDIETDEWCPPGQIGGTAGSRGPAGSSGIVVSLYRRSDTVLTNSDRPNEDSVYDFTSKTLNKDIGSWTRSIPSGAAPLWITSATAFSAENSNTDTITASGGTNEWSTPSKWVYNGTNGNDGYSCAPIMLYQKSDTKPDTPNIPITYTFSNASVYINNIEYKPNNNTNAFAGGWYRSVPDGDKQCWVTHATAASTTASDEIRTDEWSPAAKIGTNGLPGDQGTTYRITAFQPNTKYWAGDGNPKIIDVVVNKDIGFISDTDFGAWECQSTHTTGNANTYLSELPAVGSSNSQWKAYDKYNPMVTPLLISTQIEAKYIKTQDLTAGKVLTSGGNGTLNVLIEDGKVNIYNGPTNNNNNLRAAFGLNGNGDVILSFYKYMNGTLQELYNLGPAGWNKV